MAKGSTTQRTAESLHSTTDRLAESAHGAVDSAAEYGSRAEERLREQADRATRQYYEGRKRMSNKGQDLENDLLEYLHDHPYASLGMAVGAGYILGALLRRRG